MEKKNFLVKNLFYILFALCFLSVGFLTLNKIPMQTAVAEDVSSEDVTNTNIPDYFLREEFVYDSATSSTTKNEDSLIQQNTFVYFSESGSSNYLKLSLAMSGRTDANEIYQYVYYPNPDDSSLFYFYTVENYELTINGEEQNLGEDKNFRTQSNSSFENYSSTINPQGFSMVLNGTGASTNEFKITDESGNVKEGVYTLSLRIILHTCNNGKLDGSEEKGDFLPDQSVDINYSFYVLAQKSYLTNGRPNVTSGAFDNEVALSSGSTAYNLFSNYTSKAGVGSATDKNQIPYVEYDYTRFELDIKKDLAGEVKNSSLVYDKDSESVTSLIYDANGEVVPNGTEIVHFELKENNVCRVYFKDVGNYTLTLNAIKLVEMNGELHKFALDGLSSITRKVGVYMYGYQLGYTDFDQAPDENNTRPLGELKTPYYTQTTDTEGNVTHNEGTFDESADITSAFVNSNPSYSQNSTTTFTRTNIANFLKDKTPVSTNQTPIKFVSNATLDTSRSYILTTEQLPNFTTSTAPKLNNKTTLYEKAFTGQTENSAGTYIYVLAYTYKDYTNTLTIFYQIFYFEIEKGSPSITLTTYADEVADRKTIYSNTFTNQNALLIDTANSAYNKDVTVQVYAYDYTKETYATDEKHYISDFGGTNGISLAQMRETGNIAGAYTINDDGSVTLEANAKYTIRLYYSSTMKNTDINFSNSNIGLASEQIFTIDKYGIENIQGRNVAQVASGYQILSAMSTFTTNQNMVISWDKKDSGAKSYAYYRYFPLEKAQYYSSDANNVSKLLGDNMLAQTKDFLPVNNVLNLDASANNGWVPLASNTSNGGNTYDFDVEDIVSAEYVLSEAGFYLVDIFDEAGNHKVDAFFIDTSSPVFAIRNDTTFTYSITSATEYVDTTSTLYWGDFKAIYISNFNTELYRNYNPTTLNETLSSAEKNTFYQDKNGNLSTDIFNTMYEKLYGTHMQYIACNSVTTPSDIDNEKIPTYSGMYMTIKIDDVAYYADDLNTKGEYVELERDETLGNRKTFEVSENELTARLLIRDISNTKYDLTINDKDAKEQYTKYYSARQIIKISFDDSKFKITYVNSNKKEEELLANISEESEDEKISYFSPTSMDKAFKLSFVPTTVVEGNKTVQVDKVTIDYYRFIDNCEEIGGIKYYYSTLSETAEPYPIYSVDQNGASTEVFESYIGYSNSEQITNPGKYVITRTYKTGDTYKHDSKDFLTRTFVLIVDRNGVVSDPTLPSSADDGHTESLVGGDIFVSMFDNGKDSSIVVNFPNSEAGNTDGTSIYNNSTIKTILTTNKLPVNVYVPKYKYTKYVSQNKNYDGQGNETSYDFEVTNNDNLNNFKDGLQIKEYVLYAQIYKNGTNSSNLIATSQNSKTPATDAGGFLKFYATNGEEMGALIDPGEYYVRIFQGFGSEAGENCFEQSITFKFEIKSATPDFIAQQVNGASLQSDLSTGNEYSQIYYTNTSELCLIWEASTDKYKVEIDIEKITLKTKNDTTYTSSDDIWTRVPTLQENKTYLAQLDLEKLSGVYENDGFVDITMQFKNQDEEQILYKPVTKRIYVDLSAPSNNVNNLVSKSISDTSISSLTDSALRTYKTAKFQVAKDLTETSYNISNSSGTFAYYSYSVSPTYLETLKTTKDFKTYIRAFEDSAGNSTKYVSGEEQETEPAKFLATNFTELDNVTTLERNTYYEIAETDKAGNMAIYTIYVVDYESNSNLISYSYNNGKEEVETSYTTEDFNLVKSHSSAIHNIYSPTEFTLSDINFFGDAWAQINLVTYNSRGERKSDMTLMLTPNDKGYALAFVGTSTPQRVAISSLIDGSVGSMFKNVMSIYNRESGTAETFYFTIYNTSLTASLTSQQDREYIQFKNVSDGEIQSTKTGATYLTELKITAYNSTSDNGVVIYDKQNPLGYASNWESNSSVNVTTTPNLLFELRPELNFTPNATRIVYEFTDNYGKTYKEIHIYRETVIAQEITSAYDLYSFIDDGTTYYITTDFFKYTYNPSKYDVQVYDVISNEKSNDLTNATKTPKQNTDGTTTLTISSNLTAPYNNTFVLEVRDVNNNDPATNLVKEIYFILYNELPTAVKTGNTVSAGQYMILDANGNNITDKIVGNVLNAEAGYFSEARIVYSVGETFLPIKYSVSTDKLNWTEVTSGTRLRSVSGELEKYYLKVWYDETYIPNDSGNPAYIFGKVLSTQIYEFNLSALSSSYWVEMTVDGVTTIVKRSKTAYQAPNGAEYANHYIVNLDYATNQGAVEIKVNKEHDIKVSDTPVIFRDGNVVSELWFISNADAQTGSNIPAFETSIVITYIPTSDNFVQEFYTSNINGVIEKDNLIGKTQSSLIVSKDDSAVDKVMLQWSKYYGISENEINIKILKDGTELTPEIYSKRDGDKQYNYTYLMFSGKYSIMLYDDAGNIQKFNVGNSGQSEVFTFIFLKDVPFTVTYTNPVTGEVETSLPIKQAVYNGAVTLNIDESTRSEFYKMGEYPTISVKRNGVEYSTEFSDNATTFTFSEAGYYEVTFSATSKDAGEIRQETYQFTILNPDEHKISYVYNQYSNYYVEKVVKDGKDITEELLKTLDLQTITVVGKKFLTQLPISYLDEKTGVGNYVITINSNNQLFKNSSLVTSWTFKVTINRGTAPLQISIGEGSSTTNAISVKFNQANIYSEMGECTLRVVKQNENGSLSLVNKVDIDATSTGEYIQSISQDGTYFVQIVAPSGTLMFSYKVIKTAPMNAASIIAIVISAVVLVAVIFIVIKLRKRIAVK